MQVIVSYRSIHKHAIHNILCSNVDMRVSQWLYVPLGQSKSSCRAIIYMWCIVTLWCTRITILSRARAHAQTFLPRFDFLSPFPRLFLQIFKYKVELPAYTTQFTISNFWKLAEATKPTVSLENITRLAEGCLPDSLAATRLITEAPPHPRFLCAMLVLAAVGLFKVAF